ncbi:MAG: hypothetical protein ABMA64_01190 [Myxococcota bacterium]
MGSSYTIKVWSQAQVEGHTIELLDDDTTPLEYSITFSWTVGGPFVTTKTIATGDRQWNVMTAATFAIHRRDGGLPPQTFTLYNTICSSGGSCYSASADAVYTDSDSKFVVAHELGHYLAHRKLGMGGQSDLGAAYGDCHGLNNPVPSHELQQKEYQSGAFWEGFAQFYASLVFNKTTEADCFMQYYKSEDFDLDQDADPKTVNCAGVPWEDAFGNLMDGGDTTNDPAVGEDDYFFDMTHELPAPAGCDPGGVVVNRATEYDYARVLWALVQQGMTFTQILDVMNLLKPEGGTVNGVTLDPIANDDGLDPDQLADRLSDAFATYDGGAGTAWQAVWDDLADIHGVDR